MWTDKNRIKLKVGAIYSIPCSDNKLKLVKDFNLNEKCFIRTSDNSLHFGREFLALDEGEEFIDIYT